MSVMFSALTKDSVHIGVGGGKWIDVPMLSVKDYESFREAQFKVADIDEDSPPGEKARKVKECRDDLLLLAKKTMPKELHDKLERFDYMKLSALVMVLCTGDDDSESDDPQKKITMPSQMKS